MRKQIFFILIMFFMSQIIPLSSALTIGEVTTTPSQVEPGGKVNVELEIKNNLDSDVENVEVSLLLTPIVIDSNPLNPVVSEELPFSPETSSEVFIDKISEDKRKMVEFELIVDGDAEAGTYKIPVVIIYSLNGNSQRTTKQFTISVTVNSKPQLTLNVEDNLLKNRKNKIKIRITNTGLSKAKLLEVELQPSGFYEILSSNRVYIGNLDSDDFDTVSFDLFLGDKSSVSFPITLKYRDSLNKQFIESDVVLARVYSTDEAIKKGLIQKSNTLLYSGIVIAIIVLWVIYRKIKKRKKRS